MSERPNWVPDSVDVTVPSAARIYDYVLGGGHNFAVDRELAERAAQVVPVTSEIAITNRSFLRRAVLALCAAGIDQFLDLGSGIPTVGNVHEIAQQANSSARVVYVDIDHVAVEHSKLVLAGDDRSTAVRADVRDVDAVLTSARGTGLLDFDRPLGLLLVTTGHYLVDDIQMQDVMSRYREVLAPGGHLVISHLTTDIRADEVAGTVDLMKNTPNPVRGRTHAEILDLFGNLRLLEPGLVPTSQWRPDAGAPESDDAELPPIYAGIGVRS